MIPIRLVGTLDPNFAWDGGVLYRDTDVRVGTKPPYDLRGAAALVQPGDGGSWRILRDPLGLNKLFWTLDAGGTVVLAARPQRLVEEGYAFEQIRSFPRGCVVDLLPDGPEEHSIVPGAWSSPERVGEAGAEAIACRIRTRLDRYLAAIAARHSDNQVFVCLSGGLDSSGIAALAARHFPGAVAVSFDLRRPSRGASEDRVAAERLARDLGLPLLEATVTEDELFEHLDTVLVEGIDWRDFNVHAALVNAALAASIEQTTTPAHDSVEAPIVLTGDLANEFLVDYEPEAYRGVSYYDLPRLTPSALQAILVRGLETSHREVGVFGAFGLEVVQPYAVAVDEYLTLPRAFLALENRKQQLCRAIFGDLLPGYIYSRPKVRAQAGSTDVGGGVLAACVDRGFDGAWLRHRFATLHDLADPAALDGFIRAGRYLAEIPKPSGGVRGTS